MMHKGFALLDVVIALLIGAVLSLILFQSFSQTSGVLQRVVALSALERRVALIQQQFETDFSGMFAPHLSEKREEAGQDKEKKQEAPGKKSAEPEEEAAFKTFSFESDERGFVKILSFITTNPLSVYQQPSPRAVRVAYRVIADPENQGKLLLIRQESEQLSLQEFETATQKAAIKEGQKPIRSYEIARDIENIKFEFYVEKVAKKEESKPQHPAQPAQTPSKEPKKQEEKSRSFMLIEEWKKLSDEEQKNYEKPEIPAFCSLKLFMNDERRRTHTFEFWFYTSTGYAPISVEGSTSLPSAHEVGQRKAAQEETDRMFLHGGVPQQGWGSR